MKPLHDVPLHQKLWLRLVDEVAAFWSSIAVDDAPTPDFRRDAAGINRLYAEASGDVLDLTGEQAERAAAIAAERAALKARETDGSAAEKARKVLDAELIWILGNAGAGRLPDGRIIKAPTTKRQSLDADVIRREMGTEWAQARTKVTAFRTVKITEEGTAA